MTIKIEGENVKIKVGQKMNIVGKLHGDVLHVIRDTSVHLMKKFDSYGFAKALLEQEFFNFLLVIEKDGEKGAKYLIERKTILIEGKEHKIAGFEKQIFIPRTTLRAHEVK